MDFTLRILALGPSDLGTVGHGSCGKLFRVGGGYCVFPSHCMLGTAGQASLPDTPLSFQKSWEGFPAPISSAGQRVAKARGVLPKPPLGCTKQPGI